MNLQTILKRAAERTDLWPINYGIYAVWGFDVIGIRLETTSGGEKVTKRVSWFELENSRYPANTIDRMIDTTLAGLSS